MIGNLLGDPPRRSRSARRWKRSSSHDDATPAFTLVQWRRITPDPDPDGFPRHSSSTSPTAGVSTRPVTRGWPRTRGRTIPGSTSWSRRTATPTSPTTSGPPASTSGIARACRGDHRRERGEVASVRGHRPTGSAPTPSRAGRPAPAGGGRSGRAAARHGSDGIDAEGFFPTSARDVATPDPVFAMAQCRSTTTGRRDLRSLPRPHGPRRRARPPANLEGSIAEVARAAERGFPVVTLPCKRLGRP